MNSIVNFLKSYSTNPKKIDRLIISSFIRINNLKITNNLFIKSYDIQKSDKDEFIHLLEFVDIIKKEIHKFDFENLIQFFEFVVSPADRIVTGAVYTPSYIRNYLIKKAFKGVHNIDNLKIADISCGCGGFLFNVIKYFKKKTQKTYAEIFKNNIYGLDIQDYAIVRTKLLLTILALSEGEDINEFYFNLFVGDALVFKWNKKVENFIGFNIIVGNPPYVCSKNMSEETKKNIQMWSVCKSGHPDLYIPFFQIAIENLKYNGFLGFITMNTFFKSVNGRSLRKYFHEKSLEFTIIDFGWKQIFESKDTYTCLCLIRNKENRFIHYTRVDTNDNFLGKNKFSKVYYANLNIKSGWNLKDNKKINKIESTGTPLGNLYRMSNGLATLNNKIYIFKPVREDRQYYYLSSDNELYPIEKSICKDIVNSNKLSANSTLNELIEKIIFPYDNNSKPNILNEMFFMEKFPNAYSYLLAKKDILAKRDKGKKNYEEWFAFGRTQSLAKQRNKLLFPKIAAKIPNYTINTNEDLLFYNGIAFIDSSEEELMLIKKIMESRLFWYYIETTSKPYSSGYYSLSGNYINNFGIYNFSDLDKYFLLHEKDKRLIDNFLIEKYKIFIL